MRRILSPRVARLMIGAAGPMLALSSAISAASALEPAVELARGQQQFEEGNYRQAAESLTQVLRTDNRDHAATPEVVSATRLLAQVYHRSADYAAANNAVDHYIKLSPQPDAEILLIAADCDLSLGNTENARRRLNDASAALGSLAANTAQNTRLFVERDRIADALNRATGHKTAPEETKLASTAIPQDERFDIVKLTTKRYVQANRLRDAIGLLGREVTTSAYDASEVAELKLLLADCYRRQASAYEESGNTAAQMAAMSAEDRTLDSLAKDLSRQRERSTTKEDFLKLLPREGTFHERKAELTRSLAQIEQSRNPSATNRTPQSQPLVVQHLQAAAKCYQELEGRAKEIEHASDTQPKSNEPNRAVGPGRAGQYRDLALCGMQRVLEALRLFSDTKLKDHFNAELCQASDSLVEERSQRLLAADPALYDAKRAQASVYASIDDTASHKRAAAIYQNLVAYWDANPRPQPEPQAGALVGLAEMLRALDKNKEAYRDALRANKIAADLPTEDDPISRRDRALLLARSNNSLGATLISLGEYRDALNYLNAADEQLKPYGDRFVDLRRQNEQTLLVLSRVEVYRALLHKAEAKYSEAASGIRDGRELREQIGNNGDDILAYHLAEASVRLAQARDLMQQQKVSSQDPAVREALDEAERALDRAQPIADANPRPADAGQPGAALPYRYLRAFSMRLRGDSDSAAKSFSTLAQECEQQGDFKTAAKCYVQLAELTTDALAHAPLKPTAPGSTAPAEASRMQAIELRDSKLQRYTQVKRAADYADRAVTLFLQMDDASDDETAVTALPSLHFQASYLDARLQIILAALESHIARVDELLASSGSSDASTVRPVSSKDPSVDHRQRAIELLEDAIRQAERPASSTTQVRLQRARFFSRYAPAYDLLVDLYVAAAAGQADTAEFDESSSQFANLRRAIEIVDLARNRTFREQIDGWRQTSGSNVQSASFKWDKHIGKVVDPNTALLIYHLDGPQLLDLGASRAGKDIALTGGGHLFVVLDGGKKIRYDRLRHQAPGATSSVPLSRDLAAQLVRRQIGWIENPESTRDWGHAEQRALTECLLPQELLKSLVGPSAAHPIQHVVVITDGALNQLPFESLLMPESKDSVDRRVHYVIDDLPPLRYGPSLSVLTKLADSKPIPSDSNEQLLTVGNPAYPTDETQQAIPAWQELLRQMPPDGGGFVRLTHSEDECNAVYASFSDFPSAGRTKLLQAAATEAEVRKHISTARLVHIAAHGCVDYQNDNLFGALVLAPGSNTNDPQNDGLLQLREIYSLDLSHCDLAVLSACQTYVGAERPLEAGTSMARAFLEQGAQRVVCSQWSTDDQATTNLMKSFFDALQAARRAGKTIDYATALHEAKLTLRRDSERGSSPKYWAAFVLVGAS